MNRGGPPPADDHVAAKAALIRERSSGGLSALLGIRFPVLGTDRVRAELDVTPSLHQPFGILHGGVSLVLAESAASVGGWLAAPEGASVVGIEVGGSHLKRVVDGILAAEATPARLGRSLHVWDVRVWDAADDLVCLARCTLAVRRPGPAS